MGRTHIAKASIAHLKTQIEEAKKRKEQLQDYLQKLHEAYAKKEISYATYVETLHKKHDKRNLQEHINHCDYHIQECERLIEHHKKHIIKNHTLNILIFSVILIAIAFLFSQLTNTSLTGFLVSEKGSLENSTNATKETLPETNITIIEINETNITEVNITPPNESEINVTIPETPNITIEVNLTPEINTTSQENTSNLTETDYTESTIQLPARLGENVKWIKTLSVKKPGKIKISIPKESENILIKEKETSQKKWSPSQEEFPSLIEITINVKAIDYEIEYETPAPSIEEETIPKGKRIKISSPDTIHYENVLAFTSLPESLNIKNPSKIKIKWIEKNIFLSPEKVYDTNSNGIYDYVEWVVPSLSNQTFEIIVITQAEHLDSNRNFISDIYDEVYNLDNIWSETIPNQDYVRVTFEINLTSKNDITIFPRIVSGNPKIEVYEKDSNTKIAEFSNIQDNQYNKLYLTNLQESQNTFDLKVINGNIEFDHIIDPPDWSSCAAGICTVVFNTTGSTTWQVPDGVTTVNVTTVGGGGGGTASTSDGSGGGGGGLGWKNNIVVVPGNSYDVVIGTGGNRGSSSASNGGNSSFINMTTVAGYGGRGAVSTETGGAGGIYVGNGGGNGGRGGNGGGANADAGGGGGAGGYYGNGGQGGDANNAGSASTGGGGGGGGAGGSADSAGGGGGVGLASGANGTAGSYNGNNGGGGGGGSGGASGVNGDNPQGDGGLYGGGGGGADNGNNEHGNGASGVVIIRYAEPDTTAPIASFGTNPIDNYNSSSSSITFDLKVSDNSGISYLRLYTNTTGTWHANQTNSSPVNDTFWNVTVSGIADGNYIWAVWGNDTLSNQAFSTANRTFTIDTIAPVITLPFYVNGTQRGNTQSLTLNVSVTDATSSPSACNININGTNQTFSVSNGWCNITNGFLTNLADGNKTINIYVNDSVNNWNLNNSFVVDIITENSAPTITWVEAISAQDPTNDGATSITFNFTSTDTNGASDINTSTAQAFFQLTGETTRSNNSCVNWASSGNDANFTCTIDMWYFDKADTGWIINVTVKDNSGEYSENSSTTFTYNVLTAMKMSPTSLSWPEISPSSTDIGSSNDPIQVNNTGNDENLNINITAYNLQGEQQTSYYIYASNFTVENTSEGCSGITMSNATSLNITSAILQKGNHSLNYNNATSGQEQLYFCLKGVPQNIVSQSYSSSTYGSWEIRILLALLIPKIKRKKKLDNDKLLMALKLVREDLNNDYSEEKELISNSLIKEISKKHKTNRKLINELTLKEINIPVSIFTKELGALESLIKYMKENLNLSYKEISHLLLRNERTIWTAYKKSREKLQTPLKSQKGVQIPVSIFKNKDLTILELTIVYLKEKGFKPSEISSMIKRDQRNVSSTFIKALNKRMKDNNL